MVLLKYSKSLNSIDDSSNSGVVPKEVNSEISREGKEKGNIKKFICMHCTIHCYSSYGAKI